MTIKNWIPTERPREKLLSKTAAALSDAELLAILFRTGKQGKTAVDLARDLLHAFGNLNSLLTAPAKELCKHSGIGMSKYVQLQAALELSRRQLQQTLEQKDVISHSQDTKRYLSANLRHLQHEVFSCLFLDNLHHIISYEELFQGTINSANVHAREVVKRALHHNAAALIIAHNHPSGNATPSQADKDLTKQLTETMALIDVRVLDHIIVGANNIISFAEEGLL